jgi:predicted metal-dependent phosphoesterase TrpH
VIDLHLHTTASDGRCPPAGIAAVARRAGLSVISVTDHDTVAGLERAAEGASAEGVRLVPGIEITAVQEDADVHVLGYFFDARDTRLASFLAAQRADRVRRFREMGARLAALGMPIDVEKVIERVEGEGSGRSIGRPLLARALVDAGYLESRRDAFDRYLVEGGPAWVPRRAPSPAEVVGVIHDAGGVASLAHPGLLGHDEWIPPLAAAGLDAIEVYYSDHSPELTIHYRELASRLRLAMTGGSDYHGDAAHGPERPGACVLPADVFEELSARRSRQGWIR